jgi:hypothetical protein
MGITEVQQIKEAGGESGIRTLPRPMASMTCRTYIAKNANFTTLAAHHCTLLHARRVPRPTGSR